MSETKSENSPANLPSTTSSLPATTKTETSPLGDPGPDSITELFARYPDISAEGVKRVVAHLRATRGKIGLDQKPIKEPKAKSAPKAKAKGPTKKLSKEELDDLLSGGFDL